MSKETVKRLGIVADALKMAKLPALREIVRDAMREFNKPFPVDAVDTLNLTICRDKRPVQHIKVYGAPADVDALRLRVAYWDELEKEVLMLREAIDRR